jgi:hypothetical protein
VALGVSRRDAVVEIVRLVGVKTRSVDACRGLRRARVALLRPRVDSVTLIVNLVCESKSKLWMCLGMVGKCIRVVFAPPPKSGLDIISIAFSIGLAPSPRPATFFVPNFVSCCLSRAYHFDNTSTTLQAVTSSI